MVFGRNSSGYRTTRKLAVGRLDGSMETMPSDKNGGPNRRRFPRVALNLLVQYRVDSFDDFLAEYAVNLSLGGLFIDTDEPRPQGTLVYLQFSLRNGTRLIEGLGRVVRVNPPGSPNPGMGIEFTSLDEESQALIRSVVERRSSKAE